jgi:hypothetical protein
MSRFLIVGTTLLLAVAGTACSSGTSSKVQDSAIVVISGNVDAATPPIDAPADPDADSVVVSSPDASEGDGFWDPGPPFPDCVGTPEQVSNCIINLPTPTRPGIPVTRPNPMDYNLCRP